VLLYKADLVPVGEDQVQHIELIREVARKWNARHAPGFFPEPQAQVGAARRIVGLDGQAKMSKSLGNTIGILESPEGIWQLLRPAMTDPARVTRRDPGEPTRCNLYTLHQHFSGAEVVEDVAKRCRGAEWGCLDCKRVLADSIADGLAAVRERAQELKAHPERVRDILAAGASKARVIARETMREVRDLMGLLAAEVHRD
jgi:tryptophanyl-tRNA synthetase